MRKLIAHDETQTDEQAIAADHAAHRGRKTTFIEAPVKLPPQVRAL